MTRITLTVKIPKKREKFFKFYMRIYNARWRDAGVFPVLDTLWKGGPSVNYTFTFIIPAYTWMYNLLQNFVNLTGDPILLYDHSDNPWEKDPPPGSFSRSSWGIGKAIWYFLWTAAYCRECFFVRSIKKTGKRTKKAVQKVFKNRKKVQDMASTELPF